MRVQVTIPIAGEYFCEIDVPTEATPDQIYEAATKYYNDDPQAHGEVQWMFFEKLTEGNMLHASCNEWEWKRVRANR